MVLTALFRCLFITMSPRLAVVGTGVDDVYNLPIGANVQNMGIDANRGGSHNLARSNVKGTQTILHTVSYPDQAFC